MAGKQQKDDSVVVTQEIAPCTGNIYQRMNAVMKEITNVTKETKKVNGQFRYISFNKVYEDVRPLFIKHGILTTIDCLEYAQDGNLGTLKAVVKFTNIDEPIDLIELNTYGQGISGNRDGSADDKSSGKALSYLHKNAICKMLLLGGSEEEEVDNNAASVHKRKAAYTPQAQVQQPIAQQAQRPAANPFMANKPPQQPMMQPQQNFNNGTKPPFNQ